MEEFKTTKTLALQGIELNGGGALSSNYVSKLGSKEVIRHAELVSASQAVMNSTTYSIQNPSRPSLKKGRRFAFTLAEILITLGIVGVVAALVIPSTVQKFKNLQTVAQLKKSYSVIEQAVKMAEKDYGNINDWDEWDDAEKILDKYFITNLKGSKKFGKTESWDKAMCYDPNVVTHIDTLNRTVQYVFLSGMHVSNPFYANKTASMQLADGTCIAINPVLEQSDAGYSPLFSRLIMVDVNGARRAPNVVGKDLFFFYVNSSGVIKPFGDIWSLERISSADNNLACNTKSYLGGHTCAARIIMEGWKINYL